MHKLFLVTAISATLAITIGSLVSINNVPPIKINNFDKGIHLLAYFILAFNWFLTLQKGNKIKKNVWKIAGLITIYGIIIEALQSVLTDYRQADYADFIANSIGIIIAVIVFNKLFIKKQKN